MYMIQSTFTVNQVVKLVSFPGGEKKFFEWMRTKGFLMSDNYPFQKYIDRGYFISKLKTSGTGAHKKYFQVTIITIKGLQFLLKMVSKEFNYCNNCGKIKILSNVSCSTGNSCNSI